MCGIAGFVGPWRPELAGAMADAIRHRGPDGDGLWSAGTGAGETVAFSHRRLSIIDLSAAAAQPMATPDGRYVITYNGEIYNYRALRDELRRAGVEFCSHSDTEVLLHLFAREGVECVRRLDGIFAFAVWDREESRLTLVRDHLGVKPLYFAALPAGFLFASELKALTLSPDVPRTLDPATLAAHLGFLWSAGSSTMLKSVRKLRPGSWLSIDRSGIREDRYYHVPLSGAGARDAEAGPDQLRALLDEIVQEQMVADVEVGALLSGGVDSSAVVAAMCRATEPSRITAFCASVRKSASGGDNFGDDLAHARLVADRLGVELVDVPSDADLAAALPEMIWQLDEPTADFSAVQTLILSRAAQARGIKVLLSGVGGDDLFTGYGRHVAGLIWALADRVPPLRKLAGAGLSRLAPAGLLGRRLQRTGALLAMDEDIMLAEAMSYSAVTAARRADLLSAGLRDALPADGVPGPMRASLENSRGRHPVERFLDLELNGFLPDHNLNYTDKMAMQAGVEVRVPLIDRRLVDYAMALPLHDKIGLRETKRILRASQKGRVPDSVLTRPKQGFGVPLRGWLQGAGRPLLEELTSAAAVQARGLFDAPGVSRLRGDFHNGRIDAAFTLFELMAVELWCRALDTAPQAAGMSAARQ